MICHMMLRMHSMCTLKRPKNGLVHPNKLTSIACEEASHYNELILPLHTRFRHAAREYFTVPL